MNWLIVTVVLGTGLGADDAPSKPDEASLTQRLERQFQKDAEAYSFALDANRKQPLTLHAKPVMRWTAEGNFGAVWVWTEKNRPQLIGCLGSFRNGADELEGFHEFHAIAPRPLPRVSIGSEFTWEPTQGGPQPKLIDGAPEPAANHRLRLLQMRQLAREFSFEMTSGTQTTQLRLAPAPIYEYEGTDGEAIDGAIFSYLWDVGTDPEALLLLESRRQDNREAWYYVPLRFTWRAVSMKHGEIEAWRVPERAESRSSKVLRDNYVSCPVGRIDLEALGDEAADAKQ